MASYKDDGAFEKDKAGFLEQHPCYGYSGWLESNFEKELGCRFQGQRYLDWTGKRCYAVWQR